MQRSKNWAQGWVNKWQDRCMGTPRTKAYLVGLMLVVLKSGYRTDAKLALAAKNEQ